MTEDETVDAILAFLRESFPSGDLVPNASTNLLEEWLIDSFAITQIVMFLEDRFGVSVEEADIHGENFESARTLARYVAAKRGGR